MRAHTIGDEVMAPLTCILYLADAMEPGRDIGEIGLQDIRECLTAHRLSSGEYLVFLEDDFKAKVVMYRWKPT